MEINPLKVYEVNQYIKRILGSDPILYNLKVEGEISNFKHHYSGHMYFTLKDEKSKLKAVMFNGDNKDLKFQPEDGMHVIVNGYISVYERDGAYQLYVKEMATKGVGDLYVAFEKLKNKLKQEGLFDQDKKKSLPYFPKKIGVVTSSTGAAIRDIITVIGRRLPSVNILVYPVLVQGEKAHTEICKGLKYFDSRPDIDLVITGRGGGSIEELWPFNEETVARTIYNMRIPVISAVGHETDFTIADFVSDLRAPTPSAAGELAVPQINELNNKIEDFKDRIKILFNSIMINNKNQLENIKAKLYFYNPNDRINQEKERIDKLFKDLVSYYTVYIDKQKNKVNGYGEKLHILSPLSVLSRGYAIPVDQKGNVIKTVNEIDESMPFEVLFKDGKVSVKPLKIFMGTQEVFNINGDK